jgi:hypothetical protein
MNGSRFLFFLKHGQVKNKLNSSKGLLKQQKIMSYPPQMP